MYTRILLAVDGSSPSDAALREALALARGTQARLRVVHVIDSPYDYPDVMFGHVAGDLEDLQQAWQKVGREVLDRALSVARTVPLEPEVSLIETAGRRLSEAIVDEARSWSADLIVLGTHGRRGLHRLLLGSVAEGVARTSPVSVLLVREPGSGSER
ncbi:MAG TPA: universal stress protein [Candidatus Methylomirabilis sp.]|nr:universal stress protein [Candidatus Methylomirabilis sp.]